MPNKTKAFDFSSDDPERLLAECSPDDLFRAVKAFGRWDERALGVTSTALSYWTCSTVARPRDREGIGEIRSLIRRLQAIQPLNRQEPDLNVEAYYQRWNGMVSVLESRAHLLDYHDPAEVEARMHMKELRDALWADTTGQGLRTQQLLNTLKVSAPRLSQLLALAEAEGLIERRKIGREYWVNPAGGWWEAEVIQANTLPMSRRTEPSFDNISNTYIKELPPASWGSGERKVA